MRLGRACPHCGSPAWRNPCWWDIYHPERIGQGCDLPCQEDDWVDEFSEREQIRRHKRNNILLMLSFISTGIGALIYFLHF